MVLAGSAPLSLIIPHWDRKCFLKPPNGALSCAVLRGYFSQLLRVSRAPGVGANGAAAGELPVLRRPAHRDRILRSLESH